MLLKKHTPFVRISFKNNEANCSKRIVLTVCYLFLSLFIFSQRPKRKIIPHYVWQHPTLIISETKLCLTLDEKSYPVPVYNGETKIISNFKTSENIISRDILKYLDFRTFKLTNLNDSDIHLKITPLPSLLRMKSILKNKSDVEFLEEPPAYIGKLDYEFGVKVVLTNNRNKVLFAKEYRKDFNLYEVSAHNNFQIKSAELALDLVKKSLEKNSLNFIKEAFNKSNSYLMYDVTWDILSTIDFRRIKKDMYLYAFKSKNDMTLKVNNEYIDEIEKELNVLDDSPQYVTNLKKILEPKIKAWEAMLLNYNKSEDEKIYWGISANISTSYFMIGEYEKALELFYGLEDVDYRENYTYLEEFPKDALESNKISSYKDFNLLNYSGTHDSDLIVYTNGNGIVKNGVSELERQKATLLYHIFSIHEYYRQAKRYTKLFAIESTSKGYGYEEVDDFFLSLNQRITEEAELLKTFDFKGFSEDEKSLGTLVIHDLYELIELYNDELKAPLDLNDSSKSSSQKLDEAFTIKKILLYKIGNAVRAKEKVVEENIEELAQRFLFDSDEVITQLPFMDLLIDELTSEGRMSYNDNPELYQTLYEDYRKVFKSTIRNKEDLLKHLHHSEIEKVEDVIYTYYNQVYKKDIDRVNKELKNIYDSKYSINILTTFINE